MLRPTLQRALARTLVLLCAAMTVPAHAAPSRARKANAAKAAPRNPAGARAQRLGLGTKRAAALLLAGRVESGWERAVGSTSIPATLRFPVARGWFVRGFGSGAGGYHQAMDIGGVIGWNVRAAAPGLVGYAGDEITGYGNIVMLIHAGGFVTIYAHNSRNRVAAGQRVERGEVIAELGSTGRSKGPHVHFELLHAGENCDPGPLFRPAVHRKNGAVVPIARSVWKHPKRRPKGIRCHPRKHHPNRDAAPDQDDETDGDTGANARLDSTVTSP